MSGGFQIRFANRIVAIALASFAHSLPSVAAPCDLSGKEISFSLETCSDQLCMMLRNKRLRVVGEKVLEFQSNDANSGIVYYIGRRRDATEDGKQSWKKFYPPNGYQEKFFVEASLSGKELRTSFEIQGLDDQGKLAYRVVAGRSLDVVSCTDCRVSYDNVNVSYYDKEQFREITSKRYTMRRSISCSIVSAK